MSNDKKFESKDELEAWLKQQEVEEDDVGAVTEKLFANKFHKESRLRNITIQTTASSVSTRNTAASPPQEASTCCSDQHIACKALLLIW